MLDALVRDVRTRQQLLREALLEDGETQALSFVASSRMEEGAWRVAEKIREVLGVTTAEQRGARKARALFALLRRAAERAGIYVLLLGDLGSDRSDLSEEVFRGIALTDEIAPFVVINDNGATTARSSSLLHELAHIWIGANGVSGPLKGSSRHAVERFCDAVAGTFLLPPEAVQVLSAARGATVRKALSLTDEVARTWNVSQGVVAHRLLLNGWISETAAPRLFEAFADRRRAQKEREPEARDPDEGGPGYFAVRRARLGAGLLEAVRRALQGEVLTHTKAARILGVSPAAVDRLLRERPG